jgi:hypothetical protein
MKIILSSPNPGEIAQLRAMLEDAGIDCFMRNIQVINNFCSDI